MNDIPKTCILCKSMRFDSGDAGYRRNAERYDWESHCIQKHWRMYGEGILTSTFRDNFLTAETCKDFKLHIMEKK